MAFPALGPPFFGRTGPRIGFWSRYIKILLFLFSFPLTCIADTLTTAVCFKLCHAIMMTQCAKQSSGRGPGTAGQSIRIIPRLTSFAVNRNIAGVYMARRVSQTATAWMKPHFMCGAVDVVSTLFLCVPLLFRVSMLALRQICLSASTSMGSLTETLSRTGHI